MNDQPKMSFISKALGLRPDETHSVLALISASFFLGLGLVFFQTASNAIFLTVFDISVLPYVYIANAFVSVFFGFIYSEIQKRTTYSQLLLVSNMILAGITVLFWLLLRSSDSHLIIFLALIWFRIIYIYGRLGIAGLTANIFDVRQAKRIFSLIGVGTMLAFIMGGLLTSAIVSTIGTINIILLAAIGLMIYVAVLWQTIAQVTNPDEEVSEPERSVSTRQLFQDKLVLQILVLKTLATVIGFLAEYVFFARAAAQYPNEESLANFLGIFMGGMMLLMALVAVFIAGRYIGRIGMCQAF